MNRCIAPLVMIVLGLFAVPALAAPVLVFSLGTDNGSQSDFEHEGSADDHYYYENGDYSGLGTGAVNWSGGQEALAGGDGTVGFERAVVTGDPNVNIYFQLAPNEALPTAKFTYSFDMFANSGNHDLAYSMNGSTFTTRTGFGAGLVTGNFTGAAVGAAAGSNYIQIAKTGGAGPYTQFDYVSLYVTAPQLTATPGSGSTIDFGVLDFGEPGTQQIALQNTGSTGSTLDITGYLISGADAGLFDLPIDPTGTQLVGGASSVAFDVDFLGFPFPGDFLALLTINYLDENNLAGSVSFDLAAVTTPEPATLAMFAFCSLVAVVLSVARRRR